MGKGSMEPSPDTEAPRNHSTTPMGSRRSHCKIFLFVHFLQFLDVRPFQFNLTTMRFGCPTCLHFGAKLAPKIQKKSPKMPIQDASIFCLHFGIDFYAIWVPSWDPSCGHVGLLWPTKRTQDPPKNKKKWSWAS